MWLLVLPLAIGGAPIVPFAAVPSLAAGGNLIANNGAESYAPSSGAGWTDWQPTGWRTNTFTGSPAVTVDRSVYYAGGASVRLDAEQLSRVLVAPPRAAVTGGGYYDISAWVKTDDLVSEHYGVRFRLQFYNGNTHLADANVAYGSLKGTHDWTQIKERILAPAGATSMQVECFIWHGTGTVWFDELEATEVVPVVDSDNRVVNGGTEMYAPAAGGGWTDRQPTGWRTNTFSGSPAVTVDQAVYHSGSAAVRIEAETLSRVLVTPQRIAVTGDRYYDISAWAKTDDLVSDSYGVRFRLQFYNGSTHLADDNVSYGSLKGTQDWTLMKERIRAPAGATSMQLECFLWNGTGTVWFDDLRVVEVVPVTAVALDRLAGALGIGDQLQLQAAVFPPNASNRQIVWSTSHAGVATVTDGAVYGTGAGMARIVAQSADGTPSAAFVVSVGPNAELLPAQLHTVSVGEFGGVSGQLDEADGGSLPLAYELLNPPANGWLDLDSSGSWSYSPYALFTGEDRFAAVASNGQGGIGAAEVQIEVVPVNDPPVAEPVQKQTLKNEPLTVPLAAMDPDGDTLLYTLAVQPDHGAVTIDANGVWTYTPDTDYIGRDGFSILADDGHGGATTVRIGLYVTPPRGELISRLETHSLGEHPRLLLRDGDVDRIRQLVDTDAAMAGWHGNVQASADTLMSAPVSTYSLNPDLLQTARNVLDRVQKLAMAYLISEDTVYAERLWQELEAVAAFPDWYPPHFLDTAELTFAFALGYDWLYDYWTPQRRETLRTAIAEKGLEPALTRYRNGSWWSTTKNNWNQVVNGGIGMGALAIGDESPELKALAGELLERGLQSLPIALDEYAPDGGWPEGPMYWHYGTRYGVYFLDALDSALGTDYGLSDMPGLSKAFDFAMHANGKTGTFNFGDASTSLIRTPLAHWFSKRYQKPEYAWYYQSLGDPDRTGGFFDLLWYRPDVYAAAMPPAAADGYFRYVESVSMRNDWLNPLAGFIGFKAGSNAVSHGHLDLGSFVYDALGVRWVHDLGADSYSLPGYSGANRWTYYRLRAEAHNTLVINPGAGPDQEPSASTRMERVAFNPQSALAIADLTEAYRGDAFAVRRGIKQLNLRREVLLQDELQLRRPSDVWWFIHISSQAEVEIGPGGKSALLTMDDKRLWVQLLSDTDGQFAVMAASPLPTSPNPPGQGSNSGYRKLALQLTGAQNETIAVWMVPLMPGESVPAVPPALLPLEQWGLDGAVESPLADGIQVNGAPLAGFHPMQFAYEVELPQDTTQIAQVTASVYDPNAAVTVTQPTAVTGTAQVVVASTYQNVPPVVYTLSFTKPPLSGKPVGLEEYTVSGVTASDAQWPNVAEHTVDGDLSTRWSAEGEQWIQYDLGATRPVTAIAIAFHQGNARRSLFDVSLSLDGASWTTVYSGGGSGQTDGFESFLFAEQTTRYVRIEGRGNTVNDWNSYLEAAVFGQ